MRSMNIVLSALTVALLVFAIWRIEVVGDQKYVGSGQVVRSGGVETERWVGESLAEWGDRHSEAERELGE